MNNGGKYACLLPQRMGRRRQLRENAAAKRFRVNDKKNTAQRQKAIRYTGEDVGEMDSLLKPRLVFGIKGLL
jgi:hypothetical protein